MKFKVNFPVEIFFDEGELDCIEEIEIARSTAKGLLW